MWISRDVSWKTKGFLRTGEVECFLQNNVWLWLYTQLSIKVPSHFYVYRTLILKKKKKFLKLVLITSIFINQIPWVYSGFSKTFTDPLEFACRLNSWYCYTLNFLTLNFWTFTHSLRGYLEFSTSRNSVHTKVNFT